MSDSVAPWIVACQAPLSMEFSRQEYWNGLLFPPPGDLFDPQIEPMSLMSPTLTFKPGVSLGGGISKVLFELI